MDELKESNSTVLSGKPKADKEKGGNQKWKRNNRSVMLSPEVPIYLESQLRKFTVSQLHAVAKAEGVRHYWSTPRENLIIEIIKQQLRRGAQVKCRGILELTPEHHGYLRDDSCHLQAQHSDPFIPVQVIRQNNLYAGLEVQGNLRQPRGGDKHLVCNEITGVESIQVQDIEKRTQFEDLTALFPEERLFMEIPNDPDKDMTRRVIDLVTPIGKGQRGLIVAPPRVGKTILLKKIIQSIEANHKDVKVIVLLIDERPEEVTDMQESVNGQIIASTFDEKPYKHIQVANTALARAKVLVENGMDVVLLIDSITRLTRAFNSNNTSNYRMMSGGIDSGALQKTKQFFGTARNIEDGGSLTILGTTLVHTGSKMDQVIFEEFKGTGNMELYLDRDIANQRIYPAVNFTMSGTRKDELLMPQEEYMLVQKIRKTLSSMTPIDAINNLLGKLSKYPTNAEFLMAIKSAMENNY